MRRRGPDDPELTDFEPTKENLDRCRRCELWERATQGVPGRGPVAARIVLVGEQPGNDEDLAGEPFVGPAGRMLQSLLEQAGIGPDIVYVTNAVKHFHYELRGKRRVHKTPLQRHVAACEAWLEAELRRASPRVIVVLGATALAAVAKRRLAVGSARGTALLHEGSGIPVIATYHPSALLRAPDDAARAELVASVLEDLRRARALAMKKHA